MSETLLEESGVGICICTMNDTSGTSQLASAVVWAASFWASCCCVWLAWTWQCARLKAGTSGFSYKAHSRGTEHWCIWRLIWNSDSRSNIKETLNPSRQKASRQMRIKINKKTKVDCFLDRCHWCCIWHQDDMSQLASIFCALSARACQNKVKNPSTLVFRPMPNTHSTGSMHWPRGLAQRFSSDILVASASCCVCSACSVWALKEIWDP